jgi:valyl-tRNA synthetase
MSKSLGNSPDPIDIIDRVGADALRFSMVFGTPKGADVIFSESILETGRNFANKIWNAYRFIMMNVKEGEKLPGKDELQMELADLWIYSRLNETIRDTAEFYQNLRFNDAAQIIFQFLWDEFCSWYIELSKDRLKSNDSLSRSTTLFILLDVMQNSMRLLHPIMPFITEEIWQNIKKVFPQPEEALIIAAFPSCDETMIDPEIADDMSFMQEAITAVRNLRKELNLNPGTPISLVIRVGEERQKDLIERYTTYFSRLAKVENIELGRQISKPKASIAAVVRNLEIFLPLKGIIDLEAEKARLSKQVEKLQREQQAVKNKLDNPLFLTNAKPEVVENERKRFEEVSIKLSLTKELLEDIQ